MGMPDGENTSQLLRMLIQVIARAAIPFATVQEIVGNKKNQILAFNLCDGNTPMRSIAKKARVDQGSLSRTSRRWVEAGVAFRIGDEKNAKLLRVYPISSKPIPKKPRGKTKAKKRTKRKATTR
jgi:DNA-binding MarR family transcriptional regulator